MATNDTPGPGDAPHNPDELLPATSVLSLDEYLDMQAAIGDETRFRVVYTLSHFGDHSATELGELLDVAGNSLHYHLDKLVDVGLVEKRKQTTADENGLFAYYRTTSLGDAILEHGVEELIRREREYRDAYAGE